MVFAKCADAPGFAQRQEGLESPIPLSLLRKANQALVALKSRFD
jgi:hypothetical protein